MSGVAPETLRLALAITAGILALVVLRQTLGDWLRRRRIVGRVLRARKGETRARSLLEARGYRVVEAQFNCSYTLSVDGEDVIVPLRADYLVARDERRYVAEVKTGALAPSLRTSATRRQLLEYRFAFDVDGVLLVDAEAERIQVVEFPLRTSSVTHAFPRLGWIAIAVGIAALIAVEWR